MFLSCSKYLVLIVHCFLFGFLVISLTFCYRPLVVYISKLSSGYFLCCRWLEQRLRFIKLQVNYYWRLIYHSIKHFLNSLFHQHITTKLHYSSITYAQFFHYSRLCPLTFEDLNLYTKTIKWLEDKTSSLPESLSLTAISGLLYLVIISINA